MRLSAGDLVLFKESLVRDVPAAGVKKAGENFYVQTRALVRVMRFFPLYKGAFRLLFPMIFPELSMILQRREIPLTEHFIDADCHGIGQV